MVSEHYPRLRQSLPDGRLVLREGLILCLFMRRPHDTISRTIMRALNLYLDAVGHEKLGWYVDMGGDLASEEYKGWAGAVRPLDDAQWEKVRDELRAPSSCILQLEEHENQVGGFRFEYHGRSREDLDPPGFVSAVSFWLPTEYLEEHGPEHVKELAVAIAREVPLDSGYVSLAFNHLLPSKPVMQLIQEQCFRYPGMDIQDLSTTSMNLGEKVRGAYWLNFYGQTLLGRLGGAGGIRARLTHHPEVSIEQLSTQKVMVSMGQWPEAGDVEQKREMRSYRALARVLEPYLYEEPTSRDLTRRWQRRFLDT
ncbi:MAG TPA: type VI immunity family protein [Archangium sp.]|uniref:type VI immunity family protein n=1 Tax=Archangium sp. TaxID=1872627 RepID=UPI002E31DCEB|nr:type VI immunity family protein [Archangium sp.]HEX5744961.1 type VI immunity family protein [Archangium sp.]